MKSKKDFDFFFFFDLYSVSWDGSSNKLIFQIIYVHLSLCRLRSLPISFWSIVRALNGVVLEIVDIMPWMALRNTHTHGDGISWSFRSLLISDRMCGLVFIIRTYKLQVTYQIKMSACGGGGHSVSTSQVTRRRRREKPIKFKVRARLPPIMPRKSMWYLFWQFVRNKSH